MADESESAALEMRHALELLARKLNPAHVPVARRQSIPELLGDPSRGLDLRGVDLQGAWLRGLDFGAGRMPETSEGLASACLDSTELSKCIGLDAKNLEDTSLLYAGLPQDVSPPLSSLRDLPQHLLLLTHHSPYNTNFITAIASLGNGRFVSGNSDHTLRLWDTQQDHALRVFVGHRGSVHCVAALGDGRFVSGGDDGMRLWDAQQEQPLRIFVDHRGGIRCVAALGNGRFVSGGDYSTLSLWDAEQDHALRKFNPRERLGLSITALGDGHFVFGGANGSLSLWDAEQEQSLRVFVDHRGGINCVAALGNGRFVSGDYYGTLRLWDAEQDHALRVFTGHIVSVTALAVLDQDNFVSASADGLRWWNVTQARCIRWRIVLNGEVVMTADDTGLHFVRCDGFLWRTVKTGTAPRPLPCDELLHRYARFNADHRWLLPVYEYPDRFRWDNDDQPKRLTLPWPDGFDFQAVLGRARDVEDEPSLPLRED